MEFTPFEYSIEDSKQSEQQITELHLQDRIITEDEYNQRQPSQQNTLLSQKNKNESNLTQIVQINPSFFAQQSTLNFMTGLTITSDGVLRLSASLDPVSFGYQQQIVQLVEENKNLGVINIQMIRDQNLYKNDINDGLDFMQKVYNCNYQKVYEMLNKNEMMQQFLSSQLVDVNTKYLQIQKDQEFIKFINFCNSYLELYNQNNPNQMFWYSIGRLNFQLKDLEQVQMGYSKAYLELLGLDNDSLKQIFFRNKQVDLMSKKEDITNQSLYALEVIEKSLNEEIYQSSITTFDGFTLKIIQKKRNLNDLFKSNYQVKNLTCEYILTFTEIDIDIYNLQQLIEYRLRISQNSQNQKQNLDEFIKRELSYRFEDVEYSVCSQRFIEKYYNQNIQQLQQQKKKIALKN